MTNISSDTLPDWLPVISVSADDAVKIFGIGHGAVQRNKRLRRASEYLIHVSKSSVANSKAQEALSISGKIIGSAYFAESTELEFEDRIVYCWRAEQAWRFQIAIPWKGAPGTFRMPSEALEQAISLSEKNRLCARFTMKQA